MSLNASWTMKKKTWHTSVHIFNSLDSKNAKQNGDIKKQDKPEF